MVIAQSSILSRIALFLALFAVALAGHPVTGAEAAEAPRAEESEGGATASERPDSVSAMVTARVTGERVEDLSQRTETTQTFAEPDGSWTSEEATGPVRTQDEETGEWAAIDTQLMAVDGGFAPANAIGDLVVSGGGDRAFASMQVKGKDLEWRWPTVLPEPVIDGDRAIYPDAVDNGDLVITATDSGFRHDVVLREEPADPLSFEIPVVTGGGPKVREDSETGELAVKTGDGTELVSAPQPVMYDATSEDVGDATVVPVEAAITQTANGSVLRLRPDQGFLTDPATQYPVTVDPSWSATPNGDAWIQQDAPNSNHGSSQELRVGTRNGGANKFRSFVRFAIGGAPWKGAKVTSASLVLRNFETDTCSGGAIRVNRLTSEYSAPAVTWNNQPSATGTNSVDSTVAKGRSGCAAGDVSWNVTAITQMWADGTQPYGFRLNAVNESANNTWRKYRSANAPDLKPRLVVNYSRYPNTPTGFTITPSAVDGTEFVGSTTPKLSATVSDPDGGTLKARFNFYSASAPNTLVYWADGTTVTSGGVSTFPVPEGKLVNGGSYIIRAYARDSYVFSGKNATSGGFAEKTFTVDTTSYTATVTSSAYASGQWLENQPAGNTFTLNGQTGVKRFQVSQDGAVAAPVPADANGDATLTWNPEGGGHHLQVTPLGRANNPGTTVDFRFGNGTSKLQQPLVDDRSSSTFPVLAEGPPNASSAKLQWRLAPEPGTGGSPDSEAGWADAGDVTLASNGQAWSGTVTAGGSGSGTAGSATPALVWNARSDVEVASGSSALVEVRVVFAYGTGPAKASPLQRVHVVPHAFGGSFPTSPVGPGEVALSTGEFQLAETDVTVPGYGGDLTLGRTHLSAGADATGAAGVFGPGWVADLSGPDAGASGFTVVDRTAADGSISLLAPTGESYVYRHTSGTRKALEPGAYLGVGAELADDTLQLATVTGQSGVSHRLTLTEWDGTVTQFVRTTAGAWVTEQVTGPEETSTTRYAHDASGLVSWIFAPAPSGVTCTAATQTAGCRALKLNYTGTGAATRLTSIDLRIFDPKPGADGLPGAGAGMTTTTVAKYDYDTNGRLNAAWDPRLGDGTAALKTSYSYGTLGNRTVLTGTGEPGLNPWTFNYATSGADTGKLTTATRAQDVAIGGTATWTVKYGLPLSGSGLPDLRSDATATWGQPDADAPSAGAAVFGPDHSAGIDYSYAALSYWTEARRQTNSAVFGAGEWLVDTNRYDTHGNVVWSLDAASRQAALETGEATASKAAADALASHTIYDTDGTRVEEEWSPESTFVRDNGETITGRTLTQTVYDNEPGAAGLLQGRPTSAPALPDGGFDLPVRELTSATTSVPRTVSPVLFDTDETRYRYDPIQTGDGDGWELMTPTRVETNDGAGWSTSSTRFDQEGKVIETATPQANASTGTAAAARTRRTVYYTADDSATRSECDLKSQWAGLVCWEGPVGQPATGAEVPATATPGYSALLAPTRSVETSKMGTQTATRVTLAGYDPAGRPTSSSITTSGIASDRQMPAVSTSYSPATGLPTTVSSSGGSPQTQTTSYDTWGRVTTQTDGTGNTATSTYDAAGRLKTLNDGKGTYTYGYDGTDSQGRAERRGIPTSLDVGLPAGPDVFTGAYNASGDLIEQKYPSGLVATWDRDLAGQPNQLAYTQADEELLTFSIARDRDGRARDSTGPASQQAYHYDDRDRLAKVEDTRDDGCTTRIYGFSKDSNRTSLASYTPSTAAGSEGACRSTGTIAGDITANSSFDDADRVTIAGYAYDALGRTTAVSALHTSTRLDSPGNMSATYYADDMIATLTQAGARDGVATTDSQDFALDAADRISLIKHVSNGVSMREEVNHYSDGSDSPAWYEIKTRPNSVTAWSTTWARNVTALDGSYALSQRENGSTTLQLANLHDDLVSTVDLTESGVRGYIESNEYGIALDLSVADTDTRYGWLGSNLRGANGNTGGLALMGLRVYNPASGRFLSPDSVVGGNDNPYVYPADPVNMVDLDGRWGFCKWCKKQLKKAGSWAWKHKTDIALTAASFTPVGGAVWAYRGYRVAKLLKAVHAGKEGTRASRHITKAAGKKFVGKGYTKARTSWGGKRIISKDGARQYRYPSKKSSRKYDGFYSNFETFTGTKRQRNVKVKHRRFF